MMELGSFFEVNPGDGKEESVTISGKDKMRVLPNQICHPNLGEKRNAVTPMPKTDSGELCVHALFLIKAHWHRKYEEYQDSSIFLQPNNGTF